MRSEELTHAKDGNAANRVSEITQFAEGEPNQCKEQPLLSSVRGRSARLVCLAERLRRNRKSFWIADGSPPKNPHARYAKFAKFEKLCVLCALCGLKNRRLRQPRSSRAVVSGCEKELLEASAASVHRLITLRTSRTRA